MERRIVLGRMLVAGLGASGVFAGLTTASSTAFAAGQPSSTLAVSGNVESPTTFSIAQLDQLPMHEASISVGKEGARKYSGPLIRDVIAACKPLESEPHALRQSYVVAKATDGYFAVYSWAELFLSPIGDGAIVVTKRNGQPLAESEGLIAAVSSVDTKQGPRLVKWLAGLELRRVVT